MFIKNGCSYIRDCPCQLQLMPPTQFHTDKPEMIIVVAHSPQSIRQIHSLSDARPQLDSLFKEDSSS